MAAREAKALADLEVRMEKKALEEAAAAEKAANEAREAAAAAQEEQAANLLKTPRSVAASIVAHGLPRASSSRPKRATDVLVP